MKEHSFCSGCVDIRIPINLKFCCLPYKPENEEEKSKIHREIVTKSKIKFFCK